MCACQERQEAVATLQGGGDQPWTGVVLVAPEAGADEVEDRVGPTRPGERCQVIGERNVRDLAEKRPVESDACNMVKRLLVFEDCEKVVVMGCKWDRNEHATLCRESRAGT